MKPLSQLVRPNILALQPYSTARDEYAGGGIDVWLDANESPYDNGVNRYPDPHQRALKALIAELKDVDAGRIFLGNGSDEAIDLAFRIFCRPGLDNAVSIAPTYGMYRVAAATNDVQMREVPLGAGYSLPVGALLAAADERTKLIWLCSPNNPTGNAFPAQEIGEEVTWGVLKLQVLYPGAGAEVDPITEMGIVPGQRADPQGPEQGCLGAVVAAKLGREFSAREGGVVPPRNVEAQLV